MAFPLPEHTKSALNRAGKILVDSNATKQAREHALNVLSHWRACHGYPINTFKTTLIDRVTKLGNHTLVAQRLKRLVTIENKLKRFPNMKLSTMQDIGGLRAVVKNLELVRKLEEMYLSSAKKFQHELVRRKDYIVNPKLDGYRSIHLIYKYKNRLKPAYNGFQVELQIRTKLQHTWATAVETTGINLKQALKTGGGEGKWRDFFSLTSSAFAYMEGTPLVPKHENLSEAETYKAVASIEKDIKGRETLSGLNFALKNVDVPETRQNFYYHLVILNFNKKEVLIRSFPKKGIKQANDAYIKAEIEATKKGETDAVLVSAGNITMLKRAYPNYFLDIKEFINKVEKIINKSKTM